MKVRKYHVAVPGLVTLESAAGVAGGRGRGDLLLKMKALRDSGLFQYVEPDYRVQVDLAPSDSALTDGSLWGLLNMGQNGGVSGVDIGVVNAWDLTTGSTNVIVAIIDTGIRDTHQDLVAQMWRNPGEIPGNGVDDDGDGYVDNVFGINAITGSGDPGDDHGHGTHVAGTIGAAANNGTPHVGICWNVRLMACRFMACQPGGRATGYISDAIKCINFAVTKGAKILNNSWGGGGYSQALYDAIAEARNAGVLFVAAAGNDARDTDAMPNYPSCYDLENVIAVAALDRSDNLASFSNYGRASVDLGAPGVDIFSSTAGSDSEYQYFSGTSMATPHVSGVAALIAARYPAITLPELRQRLLVTTVPVPTLAGRCVSGGRVNAYNAMAAIADGELEVAISTSISPPLVAGASVGLHVAVSDFIPVTNATVMGQVIGGGALTFSNDGVCPDATAGDHTYGATLPVPATGGEVTIQLVASAPNKTSTTKTVTFATRAPKFVRPGLVLAVAQQDDGKVIIGGNFSSVNGVGRTNIARLNANGSLDETWNPGANDTVRRIVVSRADVFVLGDFNAIGGQNRNGLAKLSITGNGAADPFWNPDHPGNLHAMAVSGTDLFIGGLSYLAKFRTTGTGAGQSPWGPQPDYNIFVLTVSGTDLYVGGNFSMIGDLNRGKLVKVSTVDGSIDLAWDPNVRGAFGGDVRALVCSGADLFVGGSFNSICGLARTNIAKISAAGAALAEQEWSPNAIGRITGSDQNGPEAGVVSGLTMDATHLYVCGSFYSIGGVARTNLAKLSARNSGAAEPLWNVDTDGQWVTALLAGCSSVFVGGNFATINGQTSLSLAKLNPLTGARDGSFPAEVGYRQSAFSTLRFNRSEGLVLYGTPAIYQIEYTENLTSPTWRGLTTVTLREQTDPFADPPSVVIPGTRSFDQQKRFYRAKFLP